MKQTTLRGKRDKPVARCSAWLFHTAANSARSTPPRARASHAREPRPAPAQA